MRTVFTNRSEYLAYRAEWKAIYKQLSLDIRAIVLGCKEYDRWHQIVGWQNCKPIYRYPDIPPIKQQMIDKGNAVLNKHKDAYHKSKFRDGYIREYLAYVATNMLIELKEAKIEAQRQYLAQKITV